MLILFFLISLIILLSTIGFGLIFTKFLKFENFNYNYGLVGILGLYILSIISSYSHLNHNYNNRYYFLGLHLFLIVNKLEGSVRMRGFL